MAYLASHRGDYLGGQTGGIGSFLGRAARGLFNVASNVIMPGAPVGTDLMRTQVPPRQFRIPLPGPFVFKPGSLLPGGKPAFTRDDSQAGLPPRGYRLNKSGYWLKSGEYIPPRTKFVKVRSRNFANGKALRKAISRTSGFERLVKGSRKSLRALSRI